MVLLYTGDTQSFLEVCGCADNQLGGIARRATMVNDLKQSYPNALLVDAGGLFAGDTVLDQLRCKIHLQAMKAIHYDAANVGVGELRFGQSFFETMRDSIGIPFVSANLKVNGVQMGAPIRILDAGDVRVGIIGVAGEREIEVHGMAMGASHINMPDGVNVRLDGIQEAVASVRQKTDLIVVLSDLDREEERSLVQHISDIDIVISTRSTETTHRIGNTLLLGTQPQGKAIGQAILNVENGRVTAEQITSVLLSESIGEDRTVKRLVDEFYNLVQKNSALQQTGRPRFAGFAQEEQAHRGTNRYVGVETCKGCHATEVADWEQSHHANAFNRLLQKQKHYQPDCVTCHTTGFGYPTGFRIGKDVKRLTNVQCEVCHGPGEQHARRPEISNIRRTPSPDLCQRCHDANQTPDFDARFADMLAEVNHKGHGSSHAITKSDTEHGETEPSQDGRPLVELFVMADCPYGIHAEQTLAPLFRKLGDQIDFRLYFIADEANTKNVASPPPVTRSTQTAQPGCKATTSTGSGRFRSLHGDREIAEGIRQTIVISRYPDRFWDYILCRNKSGIATDWRICATQVNMDADKIAELSENDVGETLFAENIRRANLLGINASPTLRVNGRDVKTSSHEVAQFICRNNKNLPFCADVPECLSDRDCVHPDKVGLCLNGGTPNARCEVRDPIPFQTTILNDATCTVCDTYSFIRSTLSLFPGAEFQTVEVNSEIGQNLIARYRLDRVPAYVLNNEFEKTAHFNRFAHLMQRVGDHFVPTVLLTPIARVFQGQNIEGMDLFMDVSVSPALQIAERLLQWGKKIQAPERLRLHFVGNDTQNALFRQAQQTAPERIVDALLCHKQKASSDTSSVVNCLKQMGIDVSGIDNRAETHATARALGVIPTRSPTVVIDGRFVVQAEGLKQIEAIFYRLHPELLQRDRNTARPSGVK
ncbi:MAG: multiheme c-type cytochrome [Gemmatimonadetes bacterium]|nr:multiheme c-type cytochrome [Gemmatimonadota bacterium]